jgi:hypothetical protein
MKRWLTRPRLALAFGIAGMVLMGVDLMVTRSVFVHVAELMAGSIGCLVMALVLDGGKTRTGSGGAAESAPTRPSPPLHP